MKPKTFGVMLDCSRNAVMRPEKVKEFAALIKSMGYNMLQLYTEDTYEVEGEPYFGYMRGRYTIEEMKDMDAYCQSIGVELIPCIQVLAHLGHLPRWEDFFRHMDCRDVLLVGDPRVYELIDRMFATLSKCFTTRRIHIGMDEAFYLGFGRYIQQHGFRNRSEILLEHLNKVKELADKHGLQPMMWSDMFFHLVHGNRNDADVEKGLPQEVIDAVPQGVDLVYWDYYSTEIEHYNRQFAAHRQFVNNKTVFAGGIWTWTGYAPNLRYSMNSTEAAMRSCVENGIDEIFLTMWGDDGKDCSYFSALPLLFAASEMVEGNFDHEDIAAKFEQKFGYSFAEFMELEAGNIQNDEITISNPCKYILFNDPFLGLFDYTMHDGVKPLYAAAAKRLAASVNGRQYDYLFDFEAKLLTLLTNKCDFGIRLRAAYAKGDKAAMQQMHDVDFPQMIADAEMVYTAFRKLWLYENKAFGLEVQEMRFGQLLLRLRSCAERLQDYLDGVIPCIEELEEKQLLGHYEMEGKPECFNAYLQIISTCADACSP
ncbi:MAG: beta-N-acetylhexosaminidase [Clostridia bacterium]|nr:beta-N-acetylhexosaminidase [Clostridia bacterium]